MNKVVKVLNVADGKEIKTLDLPADGLSLSFSGDKARLLVGCADKQARVFDLATGQLVQFVPMLVLSTRCHSIPTIRR